MRKYMYSFLQGRQHQLTKFNYLLKITSPQNVGSQIWILACLITELAGITITLFYLLPFLLSNGTAERNTWVISGFRVLRCAMGPCTCVPPGDPLLGSISSGRRRIDDRKEKRGWTHSHKSTSTTGYVDSIFSERYLHLFAHVSLTFPPPYAPRKPHNSQRS